MTDRNDLEILAKRFFAERETPNTEPIELLTDFAVYLEEQQRRK